MCDFELICEDFVFIIYRKKNFSCSVMTENYVLEHYQFTCTTL